jgi:hypothetical protein
MMQDVDPARLEAVVQLMKEPDPADLPRRGHVYRYAGEPDRRSTRLPGIQMAWLQRRYLALDGEDAFVSAKPAGKRRPSNQGLRLLRPTGTA